MNTSICKKGRKGKRKKRREIRIQIEVSRSPVGEERKRQKTAEWGGGLKLVPPRKKGRL
jgi:hypothetical protein